MATFKVFRPLDDDPSRSELVLTTQARDSLHALAIAGELLCPDDGAEQQKLFALPGAGE